VTGAAEKLVLFGVGDLARVASAYFERYAPVEIVAYTVHREYVAAPHFLARPVIAFEELRLKFPPSDIRLFVAIGYREMNTVRAAVFEECARLGYQFFTYLDPRAQVWDPAAVGRNCLILEANVIQPYAQVGDDVIMWSGNHLGHDSRIDEHCFVTSHVVIAGNVKVGAYSFLGINASIRDGVTVGPRTLVGAATVILKDTKEGSVYGAEGTRPSRASVFDLKGIP
jgi:sugar O-acyltransferase (sialic acid O-acetyltransferase NeuD family)